MEWHLSVSPLCGTTRFGLTCVHFIVVDISTRRVRYIFLSRRFVAFLDILVFLMHVVSELRYM